MKKSEKKLIKKLEKLYYSTENTQTFNTEENKILVKWESIGYLDNNAFQDVSRHGESYKSLMQISAFYPFSNKGNDILKKGWYIKLREKNIIIFIRDLFLIISFIISICLAIKDVLVK